jgi:hypothetical protein
MVFQPGQSGSPGGLPRSKPWRDALHRAIKRQQELALDGATGRVLPMLTEKRDADGNLIVTTREDGIIIVPAGQALELIADMTVQQSLCGDVAARKEIGDRLDGRPPQTIEGGEIPLITAVKWIDDNVVDVDQNGNPEEE